MDKALRDRLERKRFDNMSPEDLREATLFTLQALKTYLEEVKPDLDADIRTISQAIPLLTIYLGD